NGEGSINHVVLGSVDWWFYSELAGIHPDAQNPGYEHVVIRPYVPNDLGHASASVETIRGRVASGWRKDGDKLHIDVTVPPNSRGTICVPTSGGGITEGGRKVWDDGFQLGVDGIASGQADGRYIAFETGSGSYSFDSEWR
ncbi:MAG: alpha-L-rhamnosidase C-terminal domain-containing protein, partial [Pirellulaceae bacterium]|nr:alpha-L-rhamnosidase C-terminal domain-containing protein [Pirellulaceae bacterium]